MASAPQPVHVISSPWAVARVYRLIDGHGRPHAELDEVFESLDAAHEAALAWIEGRCLVEPQAPTGEPQAVLRRHFGVEVSTASGSWRTLRHPG